MSALAPALTALLERERLEPTRTRAITTLPGENTKRSTVRIELADGRVVKGRTLESRFIDALRRWLPHLDPEVFPRLLASSDEATLEAWRDGTPLTTPEDAVVERAGEILGRLHATAPRALLPWDDERLAGFWRKIHRWLAALRASGAVQAAAAHRVLALARERRPARTPWGLRHGDFCAENLVLSPQGLACVDNTTIALSAQALDLAQTFARWPLTTSAREAFLRGHARHADAAPFLEHEPFWELVTALRSAGFRVREGTRCAGASLRRLEACIR